MRPLSADNIEKRCKRTHLKGELVETQREKKKKKKESIGKG